MVSLTPSQMSESVQHNSVSSINNLEEDIKDKEYINVKNAPPKESKLHEEELRKDGIDSKSKSSKLRFGRTRNWRIRKTEDAKKDVNNKSDPSAQLTKSPEGNQTLDQFHSSPKSTPENRLPTLKLIKKPKKKVSSSESYVIGSKAKEPSSYNIISSEASSSPSSKSGTNDSVIDDKNIKPKRVSAFTLYTKLDDSSTILHVACKRFKRKLQRENGMTFCDSMEVDQNDQNVCDTTSAKEDFSIPELLQELLLKVSSGDLPPIKGLNLESPGNIERYALEEFCKAHNMSFDDFRDMGVFKINPLDKDAIGDVSEYAQVPKKRRRTEKSPSSPSPSPSAFDKRLRKRKHSSSSTLKNVLTRSESRKQRLNDFGASESQFPNFLENIPHTVKEENSDREINDERDLLPLIEVIKEEIIHQENDFLDTNALEDSKVEIEKLPETMGDHKVEEKPASNNERISDQTNISDQSDKAPEETNQKEEKQVTKSLPPASPEIITISEPALLSESQSTSIKPDISIKISAPQSHNPKVASPDIPKSIVVISDSSNIKVDNPESSASKVTNPDTLATKPSNPDTTTAENPLDLTIIKSERASPSRPIVQKQLILNSIPQSSASQSLFNCPTRTTNSNSSNKRSLTVKKLLSLGRERHKGMPPGDNQEASSTLDTKNIMEQLTSGKISIEDESILRALLLDSTKGDLDLNNSNSSLLQSLNAKPLAGTNNAPGNISSPNANEKKSQSESNHVASYNDILTRDPSLINNPGLVEKINKLKNEILCLEVMAEQKEKERVAILCFKKYKEELLRRIWKRHTVHQSKEKLASLSLRTNNGYSTSHKHTVPRENLTPVESLVAKANDNYGVEFKKVEDHLKTEPLNLHLSPLMFRLSGSTPSTTSPSQPIPKTSPVVNNRPSGQCSALKEQLLAKPKMLPHIAPKPPIFPSPDVKVELQRKVQLPKTTSASHSILTSCLQAPVRTHYPNISWLAQPEQPPKSSNSSPAPSQTEAPDVHKCSSCGMINASFLCSGCQKEWYCSPRCQVLQWPTHAATCVRLSAAITS